MRGELCSHFNGIAMLLEDHSQDILWLPNEVIPHFVLVITHANP
jgi:hypothetical protein